ncbi:hypothetical protein KFE25_006999 [Diacronema lutheri]|uniref:Uncharacterized protein n=1 Tax=Diacronema lutheri TaxID=2081491 RepID=A0A8J6CAS1_DIALT|nr:hypothetical protein KFE25_006999 [Diacronema lutheri]
MGMALTLIAFGYVGISVIFLHMKHDSLWEHDGASAADRPCTRSCEDVLGLSTCASRQMPPAGLLCRNNEAMGRMRLSSFNCECPYEPMLTCISTNSTALWSMTQETGTCQPDNAICLWAASVAVALLIGVFDLASCLLCGCHSKADRGCGPMVGIARTLLGAGVAGPGGVAMSKAMSLV